MTDALGNLGSAAAVSQLIGQTLALVKTARTTVTAIQERPSCFDAYDSCLNTLGDVLTLVQAQRNLQTYHVQEQVRRIRDATRLLDAKIVRIRDRDNSRSTISQYGYQLFSSDGEEEALKRKMDNLAIELQALSISIGVDGISLAGVMADQLDSSLPILNRIDRNVQGLALMSVEEAQRRQTRGVNSDNSVHECGEGDEDDSIIDGSPGGWTVRKDHRFYSKNIAGVESLMMNGNVGKVSVRASDYRRYTCNSAKNGSTIVNGDIDASSFAKLISSRHSPSA